MAFAASSRGGHGVARRTERSRRPATPLRWGLILFYFDFLLRSDLKMYKPDTGAHFQTLNWKSKSLKKVNEMRKLIITYLRKM